MANTKMVLIDFDGTVCKHSFPRIGDPLPGAFETLKDLKAAGYKLIMWTCREDEGKKKYLSDAVAWCKENGVEFDAVNETIADHEFRNPDGLNRKPYAHYHIDDRNLGGFPGWDVVREILLNDRPNTWTVD